MIGNAASPETMNSGNKLRALSKHASLNWPFAAWGGFEYRFSSAFEGKFSSITVLVRNCDYELDVPGGRGCRSMRKRNGM